MKDSKRKTITAWLRIVCHGPTSWYGGLVVLIAILYLKFVIFKKYYLPSASEKSLIKKILWEAPFYFIFLSVFIGFFSDNFFICCLASCFGIFGLLYIGYAIFRFSHNPFAILHFIINDSTNEFSSLAANMSTFKIDEMSQEQVDKRFDVLKKEVPKFFGNLCKNPKFALLFFFPYYFVSIIFTVLLFGVLLRAVSMTSSPISRYCSILTSAARFFQGPEIIHEPLSVLLKTVLTIESMFSFYFIIIAIFSFSSLLPRAVEDLGNNVEKLISAFIDKLYLLATKKFKPDSSADI